MIGAHAMQDSRPPCVERLVCVDEEGTEKIQQDQVDCYNCYCQLHRPNNNKAIVADCS